MRVQPAVVVNRPLTIRMLAAGWGNRERGIFVTLQTNHAQHLYIRTALRVRPIGAIKGFEQCRHRAV